MTGYIKGHDEIRFLKLFSLRKEIAVEQEYAGRDSPRSSNKDQHAVALGRGSQYCQGRSPVLQRSLTPSRPIKGSFSAGVRKSMPKFKPSKFSSNPSWRPSETPRMPNIET